MLNHAKVARALELLIEQNNLQQSFDEINNAYTAWMQLCHNELIQPLIQAKTTQSLTPSWQERINNTVEITQVDFPYHVVGIDGSQIYPDRHLGLFCSLINIGAVHLSYGQIAKAQMECEPHIFMNDTDLEQFNPVDATNARRQEMELAAAIEFQEHSNTDEMRLYLFDGSLIFWHLVGKEQHFFDHFFYRSIDIVKRIYEKKIMCAWYISAPKSKELISLLNLAHQLAPAIFGQEFLRVRDESIMHQFLLPWHRTAIFESNVAIAQRYPKTVKPHFVYLNTTDEIARVEFPHWITENPLIFEKIIAIIADQVRKGFGYPIALAEAHEQAVVKGPDRELFFHLISKWNMDKHNKISITQKNSKKRRMSV